ncbi:MAG: sulfatase-like hydrolase/transferase [Lentisphaeria bacterium]|nr:sulfatase-like hydrolase/transferase [Lentisphaeria bacterium]
MKQSPPNILFLMADQWNHLDFGYRGHPVVRTPHLDRLAAQSVDFTHAYAQNAFCLPSRASILSGQYLKTHRQYGFTGLFSEDVPCLPELLQQNGYTTFHVGKFHCNPFGDRLGFDEFVPTLPEDMWQASDPDVSYLTWSREHGLTFPNDQVHGDFRTISPPEPLELGGNRLAMYGTSCIPLDKSIERYTADWAIEFLERQHDKPFYLSVSFDRPHGPWTPSPEDVDMYDPADIPLPEPLSEDALAKMPSHLANYIRNYSVGLKKIGEDGMRKVLSLYYALCTRVDAEIGRVLEALESAGKTDETIIVFCTDHGDMAGHLNLFDKYSNRLYHDDIIRTPLLLKLPGQGSEAHQVQQNVELIDIFPTVCGLAGIPTENLPLDGKNLLALPPESEAPGCGVAFSESYGLKTVIKDGWKLIHYVNHDEGELYNLAADPREYNNLHDDPACRAKRIDLLAELVRFYTRTPSPKRQAYIRTLFDDSEMVARRTMGKLFKWDKGIVEGDGFWMMIEDSYRLTAIPFERTCRLEKLDSEAPADGLTWNYHTLEDHDRLEAMLGRLVNYLAGKIRPISLMTGGEEGREQMMFCRGFGLC